MYKSKIKRMPVIEVVKVAQTKLNNVTENVIRLRPRNKTRLTTKMLMSLSDEFIKLYPGDKFKFNLRAKSNTRYTTVKTYESGTHNLLLDSEYYSSKVESDVKFTTYEYVEVSIVQL